MQGLDQWAIITTFAKIAAFRSADTDSGVVTRWLDKNLILIMRKFAQFKPGPNAESGFSIPEAIGIIPQFFYYLRKSVFVRSFATS